MNITEISREVQMNREGTTVTRVLRVNPYNEATTLARQLLGGWELLGSRLVFLNPAPDPVFTYCYVSDVRIMGFGTFTADGVGFAPSGVGVLTNPGEYQAGDLIVTYSTLQPFDEVDTFRQAWDFSSQNLTLPLNYYKFANSEDTNPLMSGINCFKTIPRIDYALISMFARTLPVVAITKLIGRINFEAIRLGGVVWSSGVLRFDGAQVTQRITNKGFKFYESAYKFAINPIWDKYSTGPETVSPGNPNNVTSPSGTTTGWVTWQRVFRPERGYWDRLEPINGADGDGIYKYDNEIEDRGVSGFNLLFSPKGR